MYGNIGKERWPTEGARVFDHSAPSLEKRRLNDRECPAHQSDLTGSRHQTKQSHLLRDSIIIERRADFAGEGAVPIVVDLAGAKHDRSEAACAQNAERLEDDEVVLCFQN